METLSPFKAFVPADDELDPSPLDPATIHNNRVAVDHFAAMANRYGVEAVQHMGAVHMAYLAASGAAQAMSVVATILDEAAVVVGPGAAEARAVAKAAGVRLKSMLDLFAALRVGGEMSVRTAEAYLTVAKSLLTPIFDDVL